MHKKRTDYQNIPTIPVAYIRMLRALFKLKKRETEIKQAKQGLANFYTIQDTTTTGINFLFGTKWATEDEKPSLIRRLAIGLLNLLTPYEEEDPGGKLTRLALEEPEQYSMSWTVLPDVYNSSGDLRKTFAATLEDANAASERFWPTISQYGLPYNLLIAQKLGSSEMPDPRADFADVWKSAWDVLEKKGLLYAIDMTIFDNFEPCEEDGLKRFTPGTVTLLEQSPDTKELTPIAVRVAGFEGTDKQIYVRDAATPSAWLYALQAAKVSITVYGIWLGHVYHWHIVTAAMQFTMYRTFKKDHPIRQMLEPQCQHLIAFDTILLQAWGSVAPPTAINTAESFLKLCDHFAAGRSYFDDNPTNALGRLGITEADFTDKEAWDKYAFVPYLLRIWNIVGNYTLAFVEATYATDQDVKDDQQLQKWIQRSGEKKGRSSGNVEGLPVMDSKEALNKVLQSFLYRITAHGNARLSKSADPGLTFVSNYPPCLQDASIPSPESTMTTKDLLRRMPATGTIGGMMKFYFTFSFSVPYEPLIPKAGFEEKLFFSDDIDDERNKALIIFRKAMAEFITEYSPASPQIYQWPLNIET